MSQARLLALTEEIYDAAAGGTPWTAVGGGLKALVGARSASLRAGDFLAGRAEILCHADIPEEAAAYRRHYRHVDLRTNRAAQALARGAGDGRPRALVSGEMLVPDAEFLRSEFYCDFGRHYGLRYVVGTAAQLGEAGAMPIGSTGQRAWRASVPPSGGCSRPCCLTPSAPSSSATTWTVRSPLRPRPARPRSTPCRGRAVGGCGTARAGRQRGGGGHDRRSRRGAAAPPHGRDRA